ncbi:MAG TPA: hypothetical protein DCZ91_09875 [Lachnospiraceae bacterium]|nr:hypothetical protein [Lachnospiraceae bacterium]
MGRIFTIRAIAMEKLLKNTILIENAGFFPAKMSAKECAGCIKRVYCTFPLFYKKQEVDQRL